MSVIIINIIMFVVIIDIRCDWVLGNTIFIEPINMLLISIF